MASRLLCEVDNCASRHRETKHLIQHLKREHQLSWAQWEVFRWERCRVYDKEVSPTTVLIYMRIAETMTTCYTYDHVHGFCHIVALPI